MILAMNDFEHAKRTFRDYYDANISLWRDAEKSLRAQVLGVLADQPSFATPHVVSRIKTREECISKFQRKYLASLVGTGGHYVIADHIGDLIGIRIICLYETDVIEIARLLEGEFDVLAITDKAREVEVTADTFRYKGLHLDMALSDRRRKLPAYTRFASVRFEVQIRTAIQDAWSTLDHAIKYKRDVPHELRRRINALAALFEIADREFLAIRNQASELARGVAANPDPLSADGRRPSAFDYLPVLQKHFPRFRFDDQRLRGFVEALHQHSPPMTSADLEAALAAGKAALLEFARRQWFAYRNSLSPFTLVLYSIYLHDPATGGNILSEAQRARFDEWRSEQALRRSESGASGFGSFGGERDPDWFPE